MTTEEQTSARIASNARALMLAVLCLIVVVLVMAFSLVYATTIAGNAQDSADAQREANAQLREELACRAQGATDFDLASARLQASIAQSLLLLGQQDSLEFEQAIENIRTDVAALNTASDVREKTLTTCADESTNP